MIAPSTKRKIQHEKAQKYIETLPSLADFRLLEKGERVPKGAYKIGRGGGLMWVGSSGYRFHPRKHPPIAVPE